MEKAAILSVDKEEIKDIDRVTAGRERKLWEGFLNYVSENEMTLAEVNDLLGLARRSFDRIEARTMVFSRIKIN